METKTFINWLNQDTVKRRKLNNRIKVYKTKLQEYQRLKLTVNDNPTLVMECNRRIKWILKRLFNSIETYEVITQNNKYNSLKPFISLQLQKLYNY